MDGQDLRAEPGRLLLHLVHQLGAEDPVREAGIVLDVGRQHQLTARLEALQHEGLEVRAAAYSAAVKPAAQADRVAFRTSPFVLSVLMRRSSSHALNASDQPLPSHGTLCRSAGEASRGEREGAVVLGGHPDRRCVRRLSAPGPSR